VEEWQIQIAVHDAGAVRGPQAVGDLTRDLDRERRFQPPRWSAS
jgi:hypothetical protein